MRQSSLMLCVPAFILLTKDSLLLAADAVSAGQPHNARRGLAIVSMYSSDMSNPMYLLLFSNERLHCGKPIEIPTEVSILLKMLAKINEFSAILCL